MAYIDKDYYDNVYKGEPVDEADFPSLSERASRDINELTGFKILDFDKLTEYQQKHIKLATASQLEFLDQNGIFTDGTYTSLGKYTSQGRKEKYSGNVRDYLSPTGLLYRGL